jgi:hypothetical protein
MWKRLLNTTCSDITACLDWRSVSGKRLKVLQALATDPDSYVS